mgnify:CR=1 FL=1
MPPQDNDPFSDLLTLEDKLYTSAHTQGAQDGARAGRIEGRIFGLEKGFEKYAALGELHGRGAVWGSRLAPTPTPTSSSPTTTTSTPHTEATPHLPPIPSPSTRLVSNTSLLYHLTDPPTFSTSNTETSVADLDDRFKRAGAKAKVIERIVGENSPARETTPTISDPSSAPPSRNVRLEGSRNGGGKRGGKAGDDNMEDFAGSRLIG